MRVIVATAGIVAASRLGSGANATAQALAFASAGLYVSAQMCAEPEVREVCVCKHYTSAGYLCSRCKPDETGKATTWGVGCSLPCPTMCVHGCDFEGNCLTADGETERCPLNCETQDRDRQGPYRILGGKRGCLNTFGHCESCKEEYYGLRCGNPCPSNCGKSPEGYCDRAGMCYRCKVGYYGDQCENDCPDACPQCMMKAGLFEGQMLEAGQCTQQCSGNLWGKSCQNSCPVNCAFTNGPDKPSCDRAAGHCSACINDEWWGPNCDKQCPDGCASGKCNQQDGSCIGDCKTGVWGARCSTKCPLNSKEGTSCAKATGLPTACRETYFPQLNTKTDRGECAQCPADCRDGRCRPDGTCEACEDGFFGTHCHKECEATCQDTCDIETGKCNGCKSGYTGPYCRLSCHQNCLTCMQYSNPQSEAPGNLPEFCTDCPLDEPAILDPNSPFADKGPAQCVCIESASRATPADPCRCNKPDGSDADEREEKFVAKPKKKCLYPCKPGRTETYYNHQSLCLSRKWARSIFVADGFDKGSCDDGDLEISATSRRTGKTSTKCVAKGFVDYLIAD
mmetsp:Transcript_2934/g.6658  ORF Transcript_2934/g.6658 Transcript_2934/m.6658 type:complete len:567 (+) Transcript_2934:46-1746(+)